MPIKVGTTNVSRIYVGTTPVARVYVGTDLVYTSVPPRYIYFENDGSLFSDTSSGNVIKCEYDGIEWVGNLKARPASETIGDYTYGVVGPGRCYDTNFNQYIMQVGITNGGDASKYYTAHFCTSGTLKIPYNATALNVTVKLGTGLDKTSHLVFGLLSSDSTGAFDAGTNGLLSGDIAILQPVDTSESTKTLNISSLPKSELYQIIVGIRDKSDGTSYNSKTHMIDIKKVFFS